MTTITENPPITIDQWLTALRAGDVKQGSHYLMQEFDDRDDSPDGPEGADGAGPYDRAYCCLGLACELSGLGQWAYIDAADHVYAYMVGAWSMGRIPENETHQHSTGTMPDAVRTALGLRTGMGEFVVNQEWLDKLYDASPDAAAKLMGYLGAELGPGLDTVLATSLAGLNDNGLSFSEIADVIESEPPGLFAQGEWPVV